MMPRAEIGGDHDPQSSGCRYLFIYPDNPDNPDKDS